MSLESKIKSLVVSDSLEWYFFAQCFVAELNTERLILLLEQADKKTNKEAGKIVDKLVTIKHKITEKLGLPKYSNLIFNVAFRDGYDENAIKNRKLVNKEQNEALKLFVELTKLVNDRKVFDFCR